MDFSSLGLPPEFLRALQRHGFDTPTAIQQTAIPLIAAERDVLACAPTGSGKTLAYGLPCLHRIAQARATPPSVRSVQLLVLVPTRELAVQVGQTLRDISNQLPQSIKVSVVFGGVSINPQMMAMRGGTDVVVATPGRLLDLIDHNALHLAHTAMVVLDEADRLLAMGFAQELGRVLQQLPAQRQTLLFSATFAPAVKALAQSMQHTPAVLEPAPSAQAPDIGQRAIAVEASGRTQLLRHLLERQRWPRVLVFVASKHAAEIVADKLRKAQLRAEPLHGSLSQGKRTQVVNDFKAARIQVVVATDLAARGLDIADLPVVVNYDLPRSATDYTHRIGRTGRAGARGIALSFVSPSTQAHFQLIQKRCQVQIPLDTVESFNPQAV